MRRSRCYSIRSAIPKIICYIVVLKVLKLATLRYVGVTLGYVGVTLGYVGVTLGYVGVTLGYVGVT